jgi:hypothetical protein
MANWLSDVAGFSVDNSGGTLTDISEYINSVGLTGGNALVDITGLGHTRHMEQRDIDPVMSITVNGWLNSTTSPIILPLLEGTGVARTINLKYATGYHSNGEANVGPVSVSTSIGLQTFSAEFRSAAVAGFAYTSVAAS